MNPATLGILGIIFIVIGGAICFIGICTNFLISFFGGAILGLGITFYKWAKRGG